MFSPPRLPGNNPHPARGRKLVQQTVVALNHRNNPHPARGRKRPFTTPLIRAAGNNPHPARGRKPLIARGGGSALTETTHTPQGDGNSISSLIQSGCLQETTHTPQGDGNNNARMSLLLSSRNNPHPARGRKPLMARGAACTLMKQPTPRKGTETHITPPPRVSRRNNPHPARGRKPLRAPIHCPAIRNNPHPARGRKLISWSLVNSSPLKQPTPRKGTETQIHGRLWL